MEYLVLLLYEGAGVIIYPRSRRTAKESHGCETGEM